jgi:hypothetical protein
VVNDEDNYISPALEAWLNQEAADLNNGDEESAVVMARVRFFTGHMRNYVGIYPPSVPRHAHVVRHRLPIAHHQAAETVVGVSVVVFVK